VFIGGVKRAISFLKNNCCSHLRATVSKASQAVSKEKEAVIKIKILFL
jgi:hypothetical protein